MFAYWGCLDTDRDGWSVRASTTARSCSTPDQEDSDDRRGWAISAIRARTWMTMDGLRRAQRAGRGIGPGRDVLVEFGSPMKYLANVVGSWVSGSGWTAFFFPDFGLGRRAVRRGLRVRRPGAERPDHHRGRPSQLLSRPSPRAPVPPRSTRATDFVIADLPDRGEEHLLRGGL